MVQNVSEVCCIGGGSVKCKNSECRPNSPIKNSMLLRAGGKCAIGHFKLHNYAVLRISGVGEPPLWFAISLIRPLEANKTALWTISQTRLLVRPAEIVLVSAVFVFELI